MPAQSAVVLLAAASLFCEWNLVHVIINAIYFKFEDLASSMDIPQYLSIVFICLESIPMFLFLLLLYLWGTTKDGGLWSSGPLTAQPLAGTFYPNPAQTGQMYMYVLAPQTQQTPQGHVYV